MGRACQRNKVMKCGEGPWRVRCPWVSNVLTTPLNEKCSLTHFELKVADSNKQKSKFHKAKTGKDVTTKLKGPAMIFAGQEDPFIIFRSKEIYIYFITNNKIPINLLSVIMKKNRVLVSFILEGTLTVFIIS